MPAARSPDSLVRAPGSRFHEAVSSACLSPSEYQIRKGESCTPPRSRGSTPPRSRGSTPSGIIAARSTSRTPNRGHRDLRGSFATPPRGVLVSQTPQSIKKNRQARVLFDSSNQEKSPAPPWTPCSFSSVSCIQPKTGAEAVGERDDEALEMLQCWGEINGGLDCRLHDLEAAVRDLQRALPNDTSNFSSTFHMDVSQSQGVNSSREGPPPSEEKLNFGTESQVSCKAVAVLEAANVSGMLKGVEESSKLRNGVMLQLVEELQTRLNTIDKAVLQLGQDLVSHVEQITVDKSKFQLKDESRSQIDELRRWREHVDGMLIGLQRAPSEVNKSAVQHSSGVASEESLRELHVWQERTDDLLKILQKKVEEAVFDSQSALTQSTTNQIRHIEELKQKMDCCEGDCSKNLNDLRQRQQNTDDLLNKLQKEVSSREAVEFPEKQRLDELYQWRRCIDDVVRELKVGMKDAASLAEERYKDFHEWQQNMNNKFQDVQKEALSAVAVAHCALDAKAAPSAHEQPPLDIAARLDDVRRWQDRTDNLLGVLHEWQRNTEDILGSLQVKIDSQAELSAKMSSLQAELAAKAVSASPLVKPPPPPESSNLPPLPWPPVDERKNQCTNDPKADGSGKAERTVIRNDNASHKDDHTNQRTDGPKADGTVIGDGNASRKDDQKNERTCDSKADGTGIRDNNASRKADGCADDTSISANSELDLLATEQRLLEVKSKLLKWTCDENTGRWSCDECLGASDEIPAIRNASSQRRATSLGSMPKRLERTPAEVKIMQVDDSVRLLRQTVEQDRIELSMQLQCWRKDILQKLEIQHGDFDPTQISLESDAQGNVSSSMADSDRFRHAEAQLRHLTSSLSALENDSAEIRSALAAVESQMESKSPASHSNVNDAQCLHESLQRLESEVSDSIMQELNSLCSHQRRIDDAVDHLEMHRGEQAAILCRVEDEMRAQRRSQSPSSVNAREESGGLVSAMKGVAEFETLNQHLSTLKAESSELRNQVASVEQQHCEHDKAICRLSEAQSKCEAEVSDEKTHIESQRTLNELSKKFNEMDTLFSERLSEMEVSVKRAAREDDLFGLLTEDNEGDIHREFAQKSDNVAQRLDAIEAQFSSRLAAVEAATNSVKRSKMPGGEDSDGDTDSMDGTGSCRVQVPVKQLHDIEAAIERERGRREAMTQEMHQFSAAQRSLGMGSACGSEAEMRKAVSDECKLSTEKALVDVQAKLMEMVTNEVQVAAQGEVQLGLARVQSDLQMMTFDVGGLREATQNLEKKCESLEHADAAQEVRMKRQAERRELDFEEHEVHRAHMERRMQELAHTSRKGGGIGALLCGKTKKRPPDGDARRPA
eukprot:gnl/MRDRNA2_/MRDRNA2_99496_c0_seq1.p1 gnl/MRDRNA2_/MRDRNA2_99496_c0~~gnl/MRDRNA2_/MRDRNA2_99496_c0_seq1.p1  ORF type:complete len:1371 (+),score=330.58 gnl/MRDRNA2_/MRDRNA2_99496_c0_seq1:73-4113(+)